MRLIQISVTSVWLLRAVEMDFARGKIRNRWLMMGILLGVVLWIPGMKEAGFPELLGGLLLPVLICWIPFRMRGLGAGDIKLLCVVGCLNGSRDIIYCICISFLLAAGFSFGRLLNRKQFRTACGCKCDCIQINGIIHLDIFGMYTQSLHTAFQIRFVYDNTTVKTSRSQ